MEHVVQFGISIDDERIKRTVEAQALQRVTDQLMEHVAQNLPKTYTYSGGDKTDWREYAKQCGADFLEAHRDEIIEGTCKQLAASIRQSKKFKEAWESTQEAELRGDA